MKANDLRTARPVSRHPGRAMREDVLNDHPALRQMNDLRMITVWRTAPVHLQATGAA